MQIARTRDFLQKYNKSHGAKSIGFVPTMGALHEGHLSLIRKAKQESELTVVSIFVNPAQFNDPKDLENYPRTTERDIELLEAILSENDLVFIPSVKEIYRNEPVEVPDLDPLDRVMEGKFRPGHFKGVATVVSIFFDLINPDRAYFGMKDFQQLAIIKAIVKKRGLDINIIGCPIVREKDGLAMSSRNLLLTPILRKEAPLIAKTLSEYSNASDLTPEEIKSRVIAGINSGDHLQTEYFEIVDEFELKPLTNVKDIIPGRRYFGCVAVKAGDIRLIDNMEFSFPI